MLVQRHGWQRGRDKPSWAPQKRQLGAGAMFFWFLVAVAAIVGLTVLGAFMSRRSGGWDHDDHPIGPWTEM